MPEKRSTPGVPLPTLWQVLLISSAACAGWLIWSHWDELLPGSRIAQSREADQLAEALEHLHAVELRAQNDPDTLLWLIGELTNSNPRMRRNALLALQRRGPEAQEALGLIRDRLADADVPTRRFAIDAYWHVRRDPDDVAPVVAAMLGDSDPEARLVAARVLETIGPAAVGPVTNLLGGDMLRATVPGLQVLRHIGWDDSQGETEDLVRRLVRNSDPAVHQEALLTLVARGHPTSADIRELLQQQPATERMPNGPWILSDSQQAALRAIIRLGPAAVENLPDVLALLTSNRGYPGSTRLAAGLRSMKTAARPAVPRLFELFDEIQDSFRFEIASILLEIGAEPDEVARIVIPFLNDRNNEICFRAGRLCARASPQEARRQVPALIPRLSADQVALRSSALHTLWGLAPEAGEAVPALSRLLSSSDRMVVYPAVMALGDAGPGAASAVPELLALHWRESTKTDPSLRIAIFEALQRIGPAARSALPDLLKMLESDRFVHTPDGPPVRQEQRLNLSVIWAVASIGGTDPAVLAALRKLLSSPITEVRLAALEALLELTPQSPDMLGDLLKWLSESNEEGRVTAILAIGSLDRDRREAVEPLTGALSDYQPAVRKAAAWALGRIGPEAGVALPALRESLADWKNSFFNPPRQNRMQDFGDLRVWTESSPTQKQSFRLLGEETSRRLEPLSVHLVVRDAIAAIEPAVSP